MPDLPGGVTPLPPPCDKFVLIQRLAAGCDLQNRHKKGVIAKNPLSKRLSPEAGYLLTEIRLFFDLYIQYSGLNVTNMPRGCCWLEKV